MFSNLVSRASDAYLPLTALSRAVLFDFGFSHPLLAIAVSVNVVNCDDSIPGVACCAFDNNNSAAPIALPSRDDPDLTWSSSLLVIPYASLSNLSLATGSPVVAIKAEFGSIFSFVILEKT